MELVPCQFCYAYHEPHAWRVPSLTCTRCWLEIQAGMSRAADFTRENVKRINYVPERVLLQ